MLGLALPLAIHLAFLFALGACVGSFLNVVAHRMPQDMSLVKPASHCPTCKHPVGWYDNIPVLSWFLLRGRCRHCHSRFSIQYAIVELLTGLLFVGFYWTYFQIAARSGMPTFAQGGWLVYGGHMVLISALMASSLVDLEHWIIPRQIPYLVTAIGAVLSMIWPYVIQGTAEQLWRIAPYATPRMAAAGLGAAIGLALSCLLIRLGVLTSSFAECDEDPESVGQQDAEPTHGIGIRRMMVREMAFLAPVTALAALFTALLTSDGALGAGWAQFIGGQKWCAGLLGSVFGFMMGGAVVWVTRILGSVAFGREAMGMGDVYLMAAVGAILGWQSPTVAFFVAPFLGLGWALMRLIVHGSHELPYGPFLSVATAAVMVLHDPVIDYFLRAFQGGGLPY